MTDEVAIEVNDLTVAYREQPVLWDIDLTVPAGVLMRWWVRTARARRR